MENSPDWWKTLPCHLNLDWKLCEQSNILDAQKLKNQIEDDLRIAPYFMKVEGLLYQAFLEVPPKPFMGSTPPDQQKALGLLEEAEKFVNETTSYDADAKNGYLFVIYAFRMWIYDTIKSRTRELLGLSRRTTKKQMEDALQNFESLQNEKSRAFIHATRAAALSRLGLERCKESMQLFDEALKQFPKNSYWMFGRALMQGRLARSENSPMYADPTLSRSSTEMFEKEKKMLERVIKTDPNFVWPFAYLGQCLYNLNKSHYNSYKEGVAFKLLEYALQEDKRNTDIALISARVYRWVGLYSKSNDILQQLPEESRTCEVHVQLGLTYKAHAEAISRTEDSKRKAEAIEKLLRNALDCMEEGLKNNTCHIPAAIKIAETVAILGDGTKAKNIYLNLFLRGDILPINQFHIRKSANKKSVRKIFEANDILDNIFEMLNLCVANFTTVDQNSGLRQFLCPYKPTAELFLKELTSISKKSRFHELKFTAKKMLAEIQFRLENYKAARQLFEELIGCNPPESTLEELWWYLGKCYLSLDELDLLENAAKELEKLPSSAREFSANELFADLNLAIAKDKAPSDSTFFNDLGDYSIIIGKLQQAIRYGSIEACYFYLTKVEGLQERIYSEDSIIKTLAEIDMCVKNRDTYPQDIKDKINSLLVHPQDSEDVSCPPLISNRYKLMSDIRRSRFKFECNLLQLNHVWEESCKEIAEEIMSNARKLLDWLIYNLQKGFLKSNPKSTGFPIFFDWTNAEVKKELAGKQRKELKKLFEDEGGNKVPEEMIGFIKEQQPLFNEDNNWLVFLGHFNRKDRHYGDINSNKDTFEIKDGDRVILHYEKVVLVRKSSWGVERIGKHILDFVKAKCDPTTQNME